MKRLFQSLLIFTILCFLALFFFGWMHANVDSYNYYAIGEYFRTGLYPFQEPFVYLRPTTISPPLYGIFFTVTSNVPRADILLHGLQLLLLGITSFLLYRLLLKYVSPMTSGIISCLFALFPINIIYAGSVMTETPSQFLLMLWLSLMVIGKRNNQVRYFGLATLVAAIATLMKYNLGIFVPVSLFFVIKEYRRLRLWDSVLPLVGI